MESEREVTKMKGTIYLDCDGTWIDLYGVKGWLPMLQNFDPTPYIVAKPLVNLTWLARTIHELQAQGYRIGIISWLSKNSNELYDIQVTQAKLNWLAQHMPSVEWNEIHIVKYGTPKSTCGNGILFDDELDNRNEWKGLAFDEKNLIQNLRKFLDK